MSILHGSPSPRQFETELEIAGPPDAVWDAISTADGLRQWFPTEAEVDATPGGTIVWRWGDLHVWKQTVEVCEPVARLRTRYDSKVADDAGRLCPLFIDITLRGRGDSTLLRLVQSGFGSDRGFDQEFDGIRRGWPVELRSLRLFVERHRGHRRRLAWKVGAASGAASDVWRRLTGPEGLGCGAEIARLSEGEPFRLRLDELELRGTALVCHDHEFSGMVTSHGDGFLRISVEPGNDAGSVWMWLGCYNRPQAEVDAVALGFGSVLERVFGTGACR